MRKVRKGDKVVVCLGRSKGVVGKVLKVVGDEKVVVEGANLSTKHIKPNPARGEAGGIKKIEMPLSVSNVMNMDGEGKPSRIGFRLEEQEGKKVKVRYYKTTGETLV